MSKVTSLVSFAKTPGLGVSQLDVVAQKNAATPGLVSQVYGDRVEQPDILQWVFGAPFPLCNLITFPE